MQLLMFYFFGSGAVVSALLMVTQTMPVRAALSLIACMSFLAGLYVLLDAHLIAVLQLIVYAGAIMVLFLFVIMLLNVDQKEGHTARNAVLFQFVAILVVGLTLMTMASLVRMDGSLYAAGDVADQFGTTKAVGKILMTTYVLPFEIASVLLLAAIVGAVILAKRRISGPERTAQRCGS